MLPRIGDLEELIQEEGYTGAFFDAGDSADLARAIAEMLDDPNRCSRITAHNYRAATALTMDDVADWYLDTWVGSFWETDRCFAVDSTMRMVESPFRAAPIPRRIYKVHVRL